MPFCQGLARIEQFETAVAADFAQDLLHFAHSKPTPMGSTADFVVLAGPIEMENAAMWLAYGCSGLTVIEEAGIYLAAAHFVEFEEVWAMALKHFPRWPMG